MKILFVASEAVPFCKTGGLADVVGALIQQLAKRQQDIVLVLPYYSQIQKLRLKMEATSAHFSVFLDFHQRQIEALHYAPTSHLSVYFIRDTVYDRAGIYGDYPGTAYPDNHFRFALLSKAALELCKKINFKPDILHAHDWQAGLAPTYLKINYGNDPYFSSTKSLFSIHNMAYQGNFPREVLASLDLPPFTFQPEGVEFYGDVNFLKAGLYYSDGLSTVSETYAKEIMALSEYGRGFEGLLYERRQDFQGILNGLDTELWNPQTDVYLAQNFSVTTRKKRLLCKQDLQERAGLRVDPDIPLLGFVGRLDHQKGIDILLDTSPGFADLGCQMVYLGVGDYYYQSALYDLRDRFPQQIYIEGNFAEPMAHKIYAGCDIFLMPSRFEPCGLSQMIAMRYGAIPVVTPTGGLVDTVDEVDEKSVGNGFVALEKSSHAFYVALERALSFYRKQASWGQIQRQAMKRDFGWKKSITAYLHLYKKLKSQKPD